MNSQMEETLFKLISGASPRVKPFCSSKRPFSAALCTDVGDQMDIGVVIAAGPSAYAECRESP